MPRDPPDDRHRTDHSRETERSTSVRPPERDAPHRSSSEPAATEPTPLFVIDWQRVGWYVFGALVGGGGYGLALLLLIQLVVEPATLVTPVGGLFVLFIGSYLFGLIVLLVRYPRIVLTVAVTAAAILWTASGVVPGYTPVPASILSWFGVACLGPGILAGGIHLYQQWGQPQRSGVRCSRPSTMTDHRPPRRRRSHQPRRLPPRLARLVWYYYAISLGVTCLGQVFHEVAHVVACQLFGAPIHDIYYFRFGTPSGYVTYGVPRRYGPMVGIALAPLFANTTLASVLLLGLIGGVDQWGLPPLSTEFLGQWIVLFGCGWLGISLAFHAVPSPDDAAIAWEATTEHFPSLGTVLASPVVLVAQVLSRFTGDGIELVYTGTLTGGLFALYHASPGIQTQVGLFLEHSVHMLRGFL